MQPDPVRPRLRYRQSRRPEEEYIWRALGREHLGHKKSHTILGRSPKVNTEVLDSPRMRSRRWITSPKSDVLRLARCVASTSTVSRCTRADPSLAGARRPGAPVAAKRPSRASEQRLHRPSDEPLSDSKRIWRHADRVASWADLQAPSRELDLFQDCTRRLATRGLPG